MLSLSLSLSLLRFCFGRPQVFSCTLDGHCWHSSNRGLDWREFKLPGLGTFSDSTLSFHAKDHGKIIVQERICQDFACHSNSHYTLDSFKSVKPLLSWTSQCEWAQTIHPSVPNNGAENLIICTQWPLQEQKGDVGWKDVAGLSLVSSDNFFAEGSKKTISLGGGLPVLGLASDWLVGVVKSSDGYQLITTSKDGTTFTKGESVFLG